MVDHVSNEKWLLDKSTDELDLMLGEALTADDFGAKDLSDIEKQATARRWFTLHLKDFQHALCISPIRTKIFSAKQVDRNALFAAVIDTLGKLAGLSVPVAVLSARIIHYGLDQLCADEADVET